MLLNIGYFTLNLRAERSGQPARRWRYNYQTASKNILRNAKAHLMDRLLKIPFPNLLPLSELVLRWSIFYQVRVVAESPRIYPDFQLRAEPSSYLSSPSVKYKPDVSLGKS